MFVLLASCVPQSQAVSPTTVASEGQKEVTDSITVTGLLGSIENTELNTLKIVEFGQEYLVVELDGERYRVVPDSDEVENYFYLYSLNTAGLLSGYQATLFTEYIWKSEKLEYPSMEYVVFRDYERCNTESPNYPFPCALQLVLARKGEMPKLVDLKTWDGTEATIVIWENPLRFPWIVQNITTNEMAFISTWVSAVDDEGREYDMGKGEYIWGYMYSQEATNFDPELIVSQSVRK